ncbi:uncharacterized protein [Montipora capricornis]|uniref:uncharacterized protein n=1 Tax=Montipora capricornis TaxID=246305 RepID=UPI0035F126D7
MDTADTGKRKKRIVRSREHTTEEKWKNRREWRKRKREARKAKVKSSATQGDHVIPNDNEETPVVDQAKAASSSRIEPNRSSSPVVNKELNNTKNVPGKTEAWHSRSALMLRLAQAGKSQRKSLRSTSQFKRPEIPHTSHKADKDIAEPVSSHVQTQQLLPSLSRPTKLVVKERKLELKELNPEHIDYLNQESIGSGSYGQCYHARYRGIDVVVKKMIYSDTAEDKLRAKRDLMHEAEVITALGDHERLPMILGVVTTQEPLCLVTQFHGINGTSGTLHHAAISNIITSPECCDIFVDICSALKYVHSRGFLHNDVKANNVVLERRADCDRCTPILIDFGKSRKASVNFPQDSANRKRFRAHEHGKSYLAPEVLKYRQYSTSSDVYSFGRMLKSVSKIMGFYHSVHVVVKSATMEASSDRAELDQLLTTIADIHL